MSGLAATCRRALAVAALGLGGCAAPGVPVMAPPLGAESPTPNVRAVACDDCLDGAMYVLLDGADIPLAIHSAAEFYYDLNGRAPAYTAAERYLGRASELSVAAGEESPEASIESRGGIKGTVLDRHGRLVAGASIEFELLTMDLSELTLEFASGAEADRRSEVDRADDAGKFIQFVIEGWYRLRARQDDRVVAQRVVFVPAGRITRRVVLREE